MEPSSTFWRLAATGGIVGLLAIGAFAQSVQQTEARYLSPQSCRQMQSLCDQQMRNPSVRPRACTLLQTLCEGMGQSSSYSSVSSSSSAPSCIARCSDGYEYRTCTEDGHPINYFIDPCMFHSGVSASSVSSSSSVSSLACGALQMLCIQGTSAQCVSGQWQCLPVSSSSVSSLTSSSLSSSSVASSCIARCSDGYEYRTCTQDGHPINYFVDPCRGHGLASSASSSSAVMLCPTSACGPALGMPNQQCSDGNGFSGPTGRCIRQPGGSCGWEVRSCASSSASSVISSSSTSSNSSVGTAGGCKVAGCSGELCVDQGSDGISSCLWREQYACYRTAQCARQASGQCGWTQTQELQSCLASH
jgi:hypothetical protein